MKLRRPDPELDGPVLDTDGMIEVDPRTIIRRDGPPTPPVPDVIFSGTVTIPTGGVIPIGDSQHEFASIAIRVIGTNSVTADCSGAGPQGQAPTDGPGVHIVRAGSAASIVVRSRGVTLYGTPGDRVGVTLLTSVHPPAFGTA